jgi:hypothetical protein
MPGLHFMRDGTQLLRSSLGLVWSQSSVLKQQNTTVNRLRLGHFICKARCYKAQPAHVVSWIIREDEVHQHIQLSPVYTLHGSWSFHCITPYIQPTLRSHRITWYELKTWKSVNPSERWFSLRGLTLSVSLCASGLPGCIPAPQN